MLLSKEDKSLRSKKFGYDIDMYLICFELFVYNIHFVILFKVVVRH